MQALFFGQEAASSSSEALFGWFHAPAGGHGAGHAVLMCSPWGREELSAHASLRQWAIQLADAGVPVLRFDMIGVGDSGGASDAQNLDDWLGSIQLAVVELKRLAGVSRVCLLGIRLGATLAALAAQGHEDISGLIAVAPVLRGRSYLRELTALQMASAGARPSGPSDAATFQSGGFALPEVTRNALSAVNLSQSITAPPRKILVIDRDDMPAAKPWSEALTEAGAEVSYQALPGFVRMMDDPHRAVLPQSMVDASLDWLRRHVLTFGAPTVGQPAVFVSARATFAKDSAAVLEEALLIPGTPAFGILSRPANPGTRPAHGLLLLNAGSTRHVGPSRIYVDLARALAAQGHAVLRLDLAGLGDADARPGRPSNQTYPPQAMDDVAAALRYLSEATGVQHSHVLGLCAGAYHGLTAARRGLPLSSLTLINPLVFFNAEGLSLEHTSSSRLSDQKINASAASYRQSFWSLEKWLKLLKGQAHVRVLLQVIGRRLTMRLVAHGRNLARALRLPLKDDLGTELQTLVQGGLQVAFIFAADDPGVAMLHEQGGSSIGRLTRRKRLNIAHIQQADHVFTDQQARRELVAELKRLVGGFTKS